MESAITTLAPPPPAPEPAETHPARRDRPPWLDVVAPYRGPSLTGSVWQAVNSLGGYFLLWVAMVWSVGVSYWLTLALAVPAAGFLVRIFIIQHDCGHGSFFASKKWNQRLGALCGLLTLTPYTYWRKGHAVHHAHSGNLDLRGIGDIDTLTVDEFTARGFWGRLAYRIYRHPVVMVVLGPAVLFLVLNRFPQRYARERGWKKEVRSVHLTNLCLALTLGGLGWLVGPATLAKIFLPVMLMAASAGSWLFYIQHQYEDTYWAKQENWDYWEAAVKGSSFYELPRLFQWFTGNIGFHHIHHLCSTIPNYRLQKCHDERGEFFDEVRTLNFADSVRTVTLALWDEKHKDLISFRQFAQRYPGA